MIKKLVINLLAFIPFIAFAQQSFHITGKLGSWNAPAKVYLAYRINDSLVLDSSVINQGAFDFKGQVPNPSVAALLLDRTAKGYFNYTNSTADYYQFLLGNENTSVNGSDSMKNAAMTGSALYDSLVAAVSRLAVEIKTPKAGTMAPLFEQPDSSGKIIRLADYRGKIVLVDFWASWCIPCRNENPHLLKAYRQYNKKGFEILSVSADEELKRDEWIAAIKKDSMTWTNVSDLKGVGNTALKIYQIDFIPQNFLIDRDGKIIATNLMGEALQLKLEEVYKAQKP